MSAGKLFFFVHLTGNSPYAVDLWTKPYQSEGMARAQGRRLTHNYYDGQRTGDFVARVYRLVGLTLSEVAVDPPPSTQPGDFYSVDNNDTHFCGECGNLTIGYRHEHDPRG